MKARRNLSNGPRSSATGLSRSAAAVSAPRMGRAIGSSRTRGRSSSWCVARRTATRHAVRETGRPALTLLRGLERNRVEDFGLPRQFRLAGGKLGDAEDEREHVGALLPAEGRGLVERHALAEPLEHVAEWHAVPVPGERRPLERAGTGAAAVQLRSVALHALLHVERLAALGL